MLIYSANYDNFEPIQDINEIRDKNPDLDFVLFIDNRVSVAEVWHNGWTPVIDRSKSMPKPRALRKMKFMPDSRCEIPGVGVWLDGSVRVCDDLIAILRKLYCFSAIKPLNAVSWYDEAIKVFECQQVNANELIALAKWATMYEHDLGRLQMIQTKMIWRDFSCPAQVELGHVFWTIFNRFPNIWRDQNIIPIAMKDVGLVAKLVDKTEHPHVWEPDGHHQRRRVRNVYYQEQPMDIEEFISRLARIAGYPVGDFVEFYTSEKTMAAHRAKAQMYNT